MVDSNTATANAVHPAQVTRLPSDRQSDSPPQLGVVGFATVGAIELYQKVKFVREHYIAHHYLSEPKVNRRLSASIGALYCGRTHCALSPSVTISKEVELLCNRERIHAVTIATPSFDYVLEEVKEKFQCETISLSQALVTECRERGLKDVGILGSIRDSVKGSDVRKGLSKANISNVSLPPDMGHHVTFCIEHEMTTGIIRQDKFYEAEDYCLYLIDELRRNARLDGIVVCNPELHSVALELRQTCPELAIIDAAETHWKVINDYLSRTNS